MNRLCLNLPSPGVGDLATQYLLLIKVKLGQDLSILQGAIVPPYTVQVLGAVSREVGEHSPLCPPRW